MASDDERLALLALSLVPGLGPIRLRALREHHGSACTALAAARAGAWPRLRGVANSAALAGAVDVEAAARALARCARVGAWLLSDDDPRYPEHWRHFPELPPLLWVRGVWPPGLDAYPPAAVAVVGSRRADAAACAFARDLGRTLANAQAVVVSGLAFGIDAAAHRGALAAGRGAAATLAVVAGGVDRPGPSGNAGLARALLEGGGALVSEAPLGYEPTRGDFPRRNRLIAALARAVIVVAAGEASGAQLTAGHAARFGRDVYVCPARPWDDHLGGNLSLLRDGASLLLSVAEAPSQLGFASAQAASAAQPEPDVPPDALPPELAWAWATLTTTPTPLDALLARSGMPVGATLAGLEQLVALGLCEVDGARRYRRR